MSFSLPKNWQFSKISLQGLAAVDFGHRLFSRNIQNLKINEGALSTFLSAEGKILESFWVVREEKGLLILTPTDRIHELSALIEKYHFAEAFTLSAVEPVKSSWNSSAENSGIGSLENGVFRGRWRQTEFVFEINNSPANEEVATENWNAQRIQNLIPEWNSDFDQSTLVFDVGFEELCDLGKGCYIGQEVVERVRTRGAHFPRRLTLFEWAHSPAVNSIIVNSSGQPIGSTTASVTEKADRFYSLGFVRRNSCTIGEKVTIKDSQIEGIVQKILV